MEADVHPVRKNWLKRVIVEMLCGDDFWIKGSPYMYAHPQWLSRYKWHINGNAIYKVGDPEFRAFYTEVVDPNPKYPYDLALGESVYEPNNARKSVPRIFKYKHSIFIQNWNSYFNQTRILETSPETYLVHGNITQTVCC